MVSKSDEIWPEWPQDSKGQSMVDIKVACSADDLFLLLWGPNSPFVVSSIADMPSTSTQYQSPRIFTIICSRVTKARLRYLTLDLPNYLGHVSHFMDDLHDQKVS